MKKIIGLLLIIVGLNSCVEEGGKDGLPNHIKTTKSENHQRVKGTKVFSIIPSDYQYIKELARYQKSEKLYLQVIESDVSSFIDAKPRFTKEAIEANGTTIDILKDIKINEFGCVYGEGPSRNPNETKLTMVFGDKDFLVMVSGVCENSDIEGKKELQNIFKTIFYDKTLDINSIELADFEFDRSITGFKYIATGSNLFLFSENGEPDAKNPTANSINITMLPKISKAKAKEYATNLPIRYEKGGVKLDNKKVTETTINGYTAFVLETKSEFENKRGILYQVVLIGEDKGLVFMGTAYSDLDNYMLKYQQTVKTIKIK